jgi:hypothetical protein
MSWQEQLKGYPIDWLLEQGDPGPRYLALRDLMDLAADDGDLILAQETAHRQGPISVILDAMEEPGFWVKAGPGYNPKYFSTVWSLILLSQLGASMHLDKRIERACHYMMENGLTEFGQFSGSGTPSGTVDCLQGNLCAALLNLGYPVQHLERAFEWMARSLTGEGVASMEDKKATLRYYSGKCGPGFVCGANNKLPCAWGAVKVMLAFGKLPAENRTPLIQDAIQRGIDFQLGVDPVEANYPTGWSDKPSGNWRKFGFPIFYVTDLLQNVEALVRLGCGKDPRLANALNFIREKQDENGCWSLEYDYTGKTWGEFGRKKQPNKWVSIRAAWVLKNTYFGDQSFS